MRRAIHVLIVLLVAAVLAVVAARRTWRHRVEDLLAGLNTTTSSESNDDAKAPIPAPVSRYLSKSNPSGRAPVRIVDLDTAGDFFAAPGGWKPFHARQEFNTAMPGFVWDARLKMSSVATVFVRDSYVNGRGEMVARVLALYAVAREAGSAALAEGQLARYVAEMIWFPTALAPGRGVTWTPIDDRSATAHFTDRGHSVSLRFTFNEANDVVEVFAPDRMRSVDGRHEPTPWAVRCWDHQERMGVRIPIACEAEWRLPTGALPYWRGRVTNIRFE